MSAEDEVRKLDTLEKQLAAVLRSHPELAEVGPRKARDLFMHGAQSALFVIALGDDPHDLTKIMLALMRMHGELSAWLGRPT